MKKLFYLAFAALAFAGCSDSNDEEVPGAKTTVIDFEGANLGAEGYIWGKPQARLLTDDDAESETFGAGSLFFYDALSPRTMPPSSPSTRTMPDWIGTPIRGTDSSSRTTPT